MALFDSASGCVRRKYFLNQRQWIKVRLAKVASSTHKLGITDSNVQNSSTRLLIAYW